MRSRMFLRHSGYPYEIMPFNPYGYDETAILFAGFDLPMGCLMRGVHGTFPEYHTSADNPDFVNAEALDQSYAVMAAVLDLLDATDVCTNRRQRRTPTRAARALSGDRRTEGGRRRQSNGSFVASESG